MSASSSDICGIDVQALYLHDPGNKQEPVGYILCSEMGDTCKKNACSCRRAANAEVNGTTKYFGVCVVLQQGKDCATSGDEDLTCAVSSNAPTTESQTKTNSNTTTKATVESNTVPAASASSSIGSKTTASESVMASVSTTDMVAIIVVAVVIVSLISWFIRSYCKRRSKSGEKLASGQSCNQQTTTLDGTSPTYVTGRSPAVPSFPAFDSRTRGMQSPSSSSHKSRGARNIPRAHESVSGRGQHNHDIDAQFAPGGVRHVSSEPTSGRQYPIANAPVPSSGSRREPTSLRGKQNPRVDDQRGPDSFQRAQREPVSGRSRPVSSKGMDPSGGTVYASHSTLERAAQFAQLAVFEAPPPPPRPHKMAKAVPTMNPVSKNAMMPPSNRSAAKRPIYHIPDDPLPTDYDILSPKTARSLAPSIASSATTVVAAGRNRPTPNQQNRRPPYQTNSSSYFQSDFRRDDNKYAETMGLNDSTFVDSKYEESDYGESRYDESTHKGQFKSANNYVDSFVSEVSSMAWSDASGISEDSYYQAVPSSMARIPVIEAPHDDDDTNSADRYCDWGQQSAAFRSTSGSDTSFFAASDASVFSENSDFNESKNDFKEREF